METLLLHLVLGRGRGVSRDELLAAIWPDAPTELSGQSLNTLTHSARQLLGEYLGGAAPILVSGGIYRLNAGAGVASDVERFDTLLERAARQVRCGNQASAVSLYADAVDLYLGDLCASTDIGQVLERERLRADYLTVLARLSDHWFAQREYSRSLTLAHRLLQVDPCREDAYRRTMQVYVRLGERAQAIRQYRLCERVLRLEFHVEPEPATTAMFEELCLHPERI